LLLLNMVQGHGRATSPVTAHSEPSLKPWHCHCKGPKEALETELLRFSWMKLLCSEQPSIHYQVPQSQLCISITESSPVITLTAAVENTHLRRTLYQRYCCFYIH
jgi:hypothetical protein